MEEAAILHSKMLAGVFLGYEMNAGGKLAGRYRVAALEDYDLVCFLRDQETHPARVTPQDVSRISVPDGDWVFPLRERYVQTNTTLSGVVAAREFLELVEDKRPLGVDVDSITLLPLTTRWNHALALLTGLGRLAMLALWAVRVKRGVMRLPAAPVGNGVATGHADPQSDPAAVFRR